jgi:3-dehydroquinate dehydratase / shikimate dehydrogenase
VLKPLSRHLRLARASVLIAGYGGAARAAAIALSDAGAKISITGRNLKAAQTLARAAQGEIVSLQQAQTRGYDALVHATPVGMSPAIGQCIFNGRIPADIVLDMVYNPHETLLLQRAKEQGCTVVYGSEMLIEQAARQFEIWTGESAPRGVMQKALDTHA